MTRFNKVAHLPLNLEHQGEIRQSWETARRVIPMGEVPLIMGILNVTPDSFYDGGRYSRPQDALMHAEKMVEEGAAIIDVGGESTRPGSSSVSDEEEAERILPVIRMIVEKLDVPVSVDTYKASVARLALEEGAEIINDISGLRFDGEMAETVAGYGAGVVVMHIKGTPRTMQTDTTYDDLLGEVGDYLEGVLHLAKEAGVRPGKIVVDPGIGFGKALRDNYELIRSIRYFKRFERPVMIGPSRKSFLWKLLRCTPDEALGGTISAAVLSFLYGADILRVHDVGEVRKALVIARRFVEEGNGGHP